MGKTLLETIDKTSSELEIIHAAINLLYSVHEDELNDSESWILICLLDKMETVKSSVNEISKVALGVSRYV